VRNAPGRPARESRSDVDATMAWVQSAHHHCTCAHKKHVSVAASIAVSAAVAASIAVSASIVSAAVAASIVAAAAAV
jgi:hypothetical protein